VTISHVHCRVKDLLVAVEWFTSKCGVVPSFSDARMAVLAFGPFTVILDAASDDTVATIGFNSADCDIDFATMVARGARVVQPPKDCPYGARVAYLQGPGALTIELEQLLSSPEWATRKLDRSRHVGNVNFSFADHAAAMGGPP